MGQIPSVAFLFWWSFCWISHRGKIILSNFVRMFWVPQEVLGRFFCSYLSSSHDNHFDWPPSDCYNNDQDEWDSLVPQKPCGILHYIKLLMIKEVLSLKYLNYNDILPCEVSQARVWCGRLWDFCSFSNHLKLCCIIFLLKHEPHLVFNKQKKDPGRDPFLFHHDFYFLIDDNYVEMQSEKFSQLTYLLPIICLCYS